MIVILPFMTRRNHRYYVIDDKGDLVPVEFDGGLQGGMIPHPNSLGPYGAAPHPGQGGMSNYPPPPQNGYYPNQPPLYPPQYQQPPPSSHGYPSPHQQYQPPQQKP